MLIATLSLAWLSACTAALDTDSLNTARGDGGVLRDAAPGRDRGPGFDASVPADAAVPQVGVRVNPATGLVTTEAGGTATFTIVLTAAPTATVTIGLSSSDPGEGTVGLSSVVFSPQSWNTPQTVTITGQDDELQDGSQAYTIVTAAAGSADPRYGGLAVPDVQVTNQDNDTAGVTINPSGGLTTTEARGTASFAISLNTAPIADVTIELTSSDTSEGTASPASLVFTPGNWSITQTVTVTGVDDPIDDGDVPFAIAVAVSSSDASYNSLVVAPVGVTNSDDDTAGVIVAPTTGLVTTEALGTATFSVSLSTEPTANVTIGLVSSDTSEGTVNPASLVFTPSDWDTAQTVTVTGVDDAFDDGNVAYTVQTTAASDDAVYNAIAVADVAVTNNDNDTAGVTVNPTAGLVTTEAGGTATFTVRLNTAPTADVTITLASSDTSEGSVNPTSLVFAAGNWSDAQTVTVTGADDTSVDGDVAYAVQTSAASEDPVYDAIEVPDVAVSNTDDD